MNRFLSVCFFALLLVSCKARQPMVTQVPVREVTSVELKTIEFPRDTALIRVPFERLSNGTETSGVAVSTTGLQLLWQLRNGMLNIRAEKPLEQYQYAETTVTKEVPVEVVREVEVNRLSWWQKAFMYVGLVTLLVLIGRHGYRWVKRSLVMR
ncbi:hypothetical protein [Porphyromonas levii]|uniref:hypothetical protein n=1 Tax=Porphyromonas levii TaxID=28114 RepID=UPI000477EF8E|nr:hypothetical protein [Porphyromonas levii]